LRCRQDAERASALRGSGRRHHDGDAVRRQQRRADALHDPEDDKHRQAWSKAAERRAQHEQQKAARVQKLAPHHVGEATEDRQERRHRQEIGHRDPAHGAEPCAEFDLEPREQHLCDAGIDLAHEGADAHGADHEPSVGLEAGHDPRWWGLAAVAHGVAQSGERSGAVRGVIHVVCSLRAAQKVLLKCAQRSVIT